jgi:hypothetical protein
MAAFGKGARGREPGPRPEAGELARPEDVGRALTDHELRAIWRAARRVRTSQAIGEGQPRGQCRWFVGRLPRRTAESYYPQEPTHSRKLARERRLICLAGPEASAPLSSRVVTAQLYAQGRLEDSRHCHS